MWFISLKKLPLLCACVTEWEKKIWTFLWFQSVFWSLFLIISNLVDTSNSGLSVYSSIYLSIPLSDIFATHCAKSISWDHEHWTYICKFLRLLYVCLSSDVLHLLIYLKIIQVNIKMFIYLFSFLSLFIIFKLPILI